MTGVWYRETHPAPGQPLDVVTTKRWSRFTRHAGLQIGTAAAAVNRRAHTRSPVNRAGNAEQFRRGSYNLTNWQAQKAWLAQKLMRATPGLADDFRN